MKIAKFYKLLLLSLVLLANCSTNSHIYNQSNLSDCFNAELGFIETKAAQSDLIYLIHRLEKVHYNPYLNISQKEFTVLKNKLVTKWLKQDSLKISEFVLETMKLIAHIKDGHTNIQWFSTGLYKNRNSIHFFPLTMKINVDKTVVLTDKSHPKLLNKTVKSINGIDAQLLYSDAMNCLSGSYYYNNDINESLFFPMYLHLKGIIPPYIIQLDDEIFQVLDTETLLFKNLYERLQPNGINYEYKQLEDGIGFIAYNSCSDYDAFDGFLRTTFKTIKEHKIDQLIIDLRNNSGGDSSLNDLLIKYISQKEYRQSSQRFWKISEVSLQYLKEIGAEEYFGQNFVEKFRLKKDPNILDFGDGNELIKPEKPIDYFEGKSCFLIGTKTYSSANMLADAIATFNLSTLIGKPTGERTNNFAEQKIEQLPYTKIPFSYTIAYDIGANGDTNFNNTVEPDILTNKDALEIAINWIIRE